MKKLTISIFALSALFMVSCGGEEKKDDNHTEHVEEAKISGEYHVAEGASINWKAKHYNDTIYVHEGTVAIAAGNIIVENEAVVGGTFSFDMDQIIEPGTDTTRPWTLQGHFKMADWFNVSEFATSSFTITSVNDGNVTGDMSIIGVTKEISFPAEIDVTNENVSVSSSFELDFLQFGVPHLMSGDSLPEEEKIQSANPNALISFELSAVKAAE